MHWALGYQMDVVVVWVGLPSDVPGVGGGVYFWTGLVRVTFCRHTDTHTHRRT